MITINPKDLEFEIDSGRDERGYGDVLLGKMRIGGMALHVSAIKVYDKPPHNEQTGVSESGEELLSAAYRMYEYAFETVEIPGWDGEYVIVAHPYAR